VFTPTQFAYYWTER